MPPKTLLIIFYTTIVALSALYVPQPLLALLSSEFQVSSASASLLISVTLLPLGIAPVLYGFWLESLSAVRLLRIAVLLLALSEIPFLWLTDFNSLILLRLGQGLLLPAILTALMTYLSTLSRPEYVSKKMAWYVVATILGGFLGRLIGGVMGTYAHWRMSFLLLAAALFIAWWLLSFLQSEAKLHLQRPRFVDIHATLSHPLYRYIYALIFLVFFCFAAMLNFIPFRLQEIQPDISTFSISLIYSGYMIGLAMALSTQRIRLWLGNNLTLFIGLSSYLCAILLLTLPRFEWVFLNMFLFCAGMFLIHSLLSGQLNQLAPAKKGIVNGLYISFYYLGGAAGAYLPGFIYRSFGWMSFSLSLAGLMVIALLIALQLRRAGF